MNGRGLGLAAVLAALAAGCGGEDTAPSAETSATEELAPGLYESASTVTGLRSTDKTQPATEMVEGATGTARGCIAADGAIDASLFAEGDDQCTATSSFVRKGRISLQLDCKRAGTPGQVLQSVNARGSGSTFEGEVSTSTYLSGEGDYAMTRTVTGRRVGECPPEGAGEADTGNAADAG